MNADSPAATSGGSGSFSGWAFPFTPRCYQSSDVVVACGAFQRFFRDERADRRIELRERALECAVPVVAARAGVAGRQRRALRGGGAEQVEHAAVRVRGRIDEVDLEVGELRLREP